MNNDGVTETTWSKLGGVDENWTHSELRVPPNTNQVNTFIMHFNQQSLS